jgi:hypothetical protein
MPYYCMNTNPQHNGDHEVHDVNKCTRLPHPVNRRDLGWQPDCQSAVRAAKVYDSQADGCYYCCPECHTS